MIIDMSYWTRVLKKFLYVILILIGLFLACNILHAIFNCIYNIINDRTSNKIYNEKTKIHQKNKFNNYICNSIWNNYRGSSVGDSSIDFRSIKSIARLK